MLELHHRHYANNDLRYSLEEYNEEYESMKMISRTTNIEQKILKNGIDPKMDVEFEVEVGRGKNRTTERCADEISAETIYKLVTTAVKERGLEERLKECSMSRNLKSMTDETVAWILTNEKSTKKARALKSDRQKGWVDRIVHVALREKSLVSKDEAEQDGSIAFSNPNVREFMSLYLAQKDAVKGSAKGGNSSFKTIGLSAKDIEEDDKVLNEIRSELKRDDISLDRKAQLIQMKHALLQGRSQIIKDKHATMTLALDQVNRNVLASMEKTEQRMLERAEQKFLEERSLGNE